ncbi:MAG: glycosyltransferase family 1 protein [Chloroflexi bacterium]|nr:glycosyltransferase family 1 protein [Chloroflexota bacterium]
MRISIPTIGSRGDVQPHIALAQGLQRAGHRVTVLSHPCWGDLVSAHGVPFTPIGPDIDLGQWTADLRLRSRFPLLALMRVIKATADLLAEAHPDILAGCQGVDLVVVSESTTTGKNEADLLGLPTVSITLMPWVLPGPNPDSSLFQHMGYRAGEWLLWWLKLRPMNRVRKKLGLPPVGSEGFTSERLNLIPISEAVYQRYPYWAPHHKMCGYWFANEPQGWQPPADLLTFLAAGDPPLVISLGAMSLNPDDALGNARLFVDALRRAGARAIIQGWDEGLHQLELPPTIYPAGPMPHSWLLPRAGGVVHHGGYGSTAAGIRAGIPALVIPHIGDQFIWGRRIHALGVGPAPIPRAKLTPHNLTAVLQDVVTNDALRVAAAQLGAQVRAETGVDNAVAMIEDVMASA